MESLDAVPSADYASLLSISPPTNVTQTVPFCSVDRNQNFNKPSHEHIYAQVTQNGHCHPVESTIQEPKTNAVPKDDFKAQVLPNRTLMNNTIILRNPTVSLSHSSSVPDVRRPYPNLPSLCPNNYGSLNATKVENKALTKKSESTADASVFSISGRRVVVSNGFKGNGNNKKINDVKAPVSAPNLPNGSPNLWSRRSSVDSQTETKRRKLQVCTDCFSLCLFVPGTVLCIISPWLLVPIYIIPNFSGSHFQTLIWVSCIGSAILVFMGCMIGNLVWYRKGEAWKCSLHCGKGPKNHYWGDSLTSRRTMHTV